MQHKNNGFTLLEVVIALTIISVGFFAIFRLHSRTISLNGDIRFYINASLLAREKLAEITVNPESMADSSGEFEDDFEGYIWNAVVTNIDSEISENIGADLKRIEITISFKNSKMSYSTSVIKYIREES